MSNIIINLRATSGGGKSTVAFTMLKNFPHAEWKDEKGKTLGYRIDASSAGLKHQIRLIGRYSTVCGGADTINRQVEAADRCLSAWKDGDHVLIEGLLASAAGPKGALTAALIETKSAVFGILDTPEQVCLDRVRARRAARGDERPFNETNTRAKYKQTMQTAKAMYDAGYDVRAIDHTRAYEHVMDIFRSAE